MKRFLTFMLVGLLAFVSSCKEEDQPDQPTAHAELSIVQAGSDSLVLKLTTKDVARSAYICQPTATATPQAPEYIIKNGVEIPTKDGDNTFTIKNLDPSTEYKVSVAAETAKGELIPTPIEVTVTTDNIEKLAKVELALVEAGSESLTIKVTTNVIKECAYICEPAESAEGGTPEYLFEKGTVISTVDGENTFTIDSLLPQKEYKITLAAKIINDKFVEKPFELIVKTADYEKLVTLIDQKYNGYAVHIQIPESIEKNDSLAIRYTAACLPMYNFRKYQFPFPGGVPDAEALTDNGGVYLRASQDVIIDEEHGVIEDPEMGTIVIYDPIAPGEPCVFMAGEFEFGEDEYGRGEGYYNAKFDYDGYMKAIEETGEANEADYWTGLYQKELVSSRAPQHMDNKLNIEAIKLTPNTALYSFKPEEGVMQYIILPIDEETYGFVMQLLENNTDYLQWFTTSFFAFAMLNANVY